MARSLFYLTHSIYARVSRENLASLVSQDFAIAFSSFEIEKEEGCEGMGSSHDTTTTSIQSNDLKAFALNYENMMSQEYWPFRNEFPYP